MKVIPAFQIIKSPENGVVEQKHYKMTQSKRLFFVVVVEITEQVIPDQLAVAGENA